MIKSIEINGYRILDKFSADLGGLTVVIGANATGKSTLISLLQLITTSTLMPLNGALGASGQVFPWVLNAAHQPEEVGWKLTFNTHHPLDRYRLQLTPPQVFIYEVEIGKTPYGQPIPTKEILRFVHGRGVKNETILLMNQSGRLRVFNSKTERLLDFSRSADESKHQDNTQTAKRSRKNKKSTFKQEELGQAEPTLLLAKMQFSSEYPEAFFARNVLSSCAFYSGFDVSRNSALRTKLAELQPWPPLFQSGENLGSVFHEMLTRHEAKFRAEEIMDFVRAAYPYVETITAETGYGNPPGVLIRSHEKGMSRPIEIWDLSDGFLRFLCLAAALLNPSAPSFIALDEPEAGLHPRLLPIVADMIKAAAEQTQVMVTTHSPDLLNCFDLDSIAVMAREDNRIRWGRPGDRKSLRTMLKNVEADSLGDLHRSGELEALG